MAFKLRKTTPKRRSNIQSKSHYRQYREELAIDFEHHCGYCGDSDTPRKESFEIDHFIPKKYLNTISENDSSHHKKKIRAVSYRKKVHEYPDFE